ncbi:unnamed protein product, partial [Closterium sp. NIES-65]
LALVTAEVQSCTFERNSVSGSGGAIYSEARVLALVTAEVQSCTFERNSVSGSGGAIYSEGTGYLRIMGSTFTANSVQLKDGGALYVIAVSEVLLGQRGTGGEGWGWVGWAGHGCHTICSEGTGYLRIMGLLSLPTPCSSRTAALSMSSWQAAQGSVHGQQSLQLSSPLVFALPPFVPLLLSRCLHPPSLNLGGQQRDRQRRGRSRRVPIGHGFRDYYGGWSKFRENRAGSGGGVGKVSGSGRLVMTRCEVEANESPTGGALWVEMEGVVEDTRSSFTGNKASFEGGAVFATHSATVTLLSSQFGSNSALRGGGMVLDTDATLTSTSSSFLNNSASALLIRGSSQATLTTAFFSGNSAPAGTGGAIWAAAETSLTVRSSNLTNNTAVTGGGIFSEGSAQVTLDASRFEGNNAVTGAALAAAGSSKFSAGNLTLVKNSASRAGGAAAFLDQSNGLFKGAWMTGNKAVVGGAGVYVKRAETLGITSSGAAAAGNSTGAPATGSAPAAAAAAVNDAGSAASAASGANSSSSMGVGKAELAPLVCSNLTFSENEALYPQGVAFYEASFNPAVRIGCDECVREQESQTIGSIPKNFYFTFTGMDEGANGLGTVPSFVALTAVGTPIAGLTVVIVDDYNNTVVQDNSSFVAIAPDRRISGLLRATAVQGLAELPEVSVMVTPDEATPFRLLVTVSSPTNEFPDITHTFTVDFCAAGTFLNTTSEDGTGGDGGGSSTSSTGSGTCDPCPVGSWCEAGQPSTPCDDGSFTFYPYSTSADECVACEDDNLDCTGGELTIATQAWLDPRTYNDTPTTYSCIITNGCVEHLYEYNLTTNTADVEICPTGYDPSSPVLPFSPPLLKCACAVCAPTTTTRSSAIVLRVDSKAFPSFSSFPFTSTCSMCCLCANNYYSFLGDCNYCSDVFKKVHALANNHLCSHSHLCVPPYLCALYVCAFTPHLLPLPCQPTPTTPFPPLPSHTALPAALHPHDWSVGGHVSPCQQPLMCSHLSCIAPPTPPLPLSTQLFPLLFILMIGVWVAMFLLANNYDNIDIFLTEVPPVSMLDTCRLSQLQSSSPSFLLLPLANNYDNIDIFLTEVQYLTVVASINLNAPAAPNGWVGWLIKIYKPLRLRPRRGWTQLTWGPNCVLTYRFPQQFVFGILIFLVGLVVYALHWCLFLLREHIKLLKAKRTAENGETSGVGQLSSTAAKQRRQEYYNGLVGGVASWLDVCYMGILARVLPVFQSQMVGDTKVRCYEWVAGHGAAEQHGGEAAGGRSITTGWWGAWRCWLDVCYMGILARVLPVFQSQMVGDTKVMLFVPEIDPKPHRSPLVTISSLPLPPSQVMLFAPEIEWLSSTHMGMLIPSIIILIVYLAGVPLLYACCSSQPSGTARSSPLTKWNRTLFTAEWHLLNMSLRVLWHLLNMSLWVLYGGILVFLYQNPEAHSPPPPRFPFTSTKPITPPPGGTCSTCRCECSTAASLSSPTRAPRLTLLPLSLCTPPLHHPSPRWHLLNMSLRVLYGCILVFLYENPEAQIIILVVLQILRIVVEYRFAPFTSSSVEYLQATLNLGEVFFTLSLLIFNYTSESILSEVIMAISTVLMLLPAIVAISYEVSSKRMEAFNNSVLDEIWEQESGKREDQLRGLDPYQIVQLTQSGEREDQLRGLDPYQIVQLTQVGGWGSSLQSTQKQGLVFAVDSKAGARLCSRLKSRGSSLQSTQKQGLVFAVDSKAGLVFAVDSKAGARLCSRLKKQGLVFAVDSKAGARLCSRLKSRGSSLQSTQKQGLVFAVDSKAGARLCSRLKSRGLVFAVDSKAGARLCSRLKSRGSSLQSTQKQGLVFAVDSKAGARLCSRLKSVRACLSVRTNTKWEDQLRGLDPCQIVQLTQESGSPLPPTGALPVRASLSGHRPAAEGVNLPSPPSLASLSPYQIGEWFRSRALFQFLHHRQGIGLLLRTHDAAGRVRLSPHSWPRALFQFLHHRQGIDLLLRVRDRVQACSLAGLGEIGGWFRPRALFQFLHHRQGIDLLLRVRDRVQACSLAGLGEVEWIEQLKKPQQYAGLSQILLGNKKGYIPVARLPPQGVYCLLHGVWHADGACTAAQAAAAARRRTNRRTKSRSSRVSFGGGMGEGGPETPGSGLRRMVSWGSNTPGGASMREKPVKSLKIAEKSWPPQLGRKVHWCPASGFDPLAATKRFGSGRMGAGGMAGTPTGGGGGWGGGEEARTPYPVAPETPTGMPETPVTPAAPAAPAPAAAVNGGGDGDSKPKKRLLRQLSDRDDSDTEGAAAGAGAGAGAGGGGAGSRPGTAGTPGAGGGIMRGAISRPGSSGGAAIGGAGGGGMEVVQANLDMAELTFAFQSNLALLVKAEKKRKVQKEALRQIIHSKATYHILSWFTSEESTVDDQRLFAELVKAVRQAAKTRKRSMRWLQGAQCFYPGEGRLTNQLSKML